MSDSDLYLPPVHQTAANPDLPDPFLGPAGRIEEPGEWPRQRAYLCDLAQAAMYGKLPPPPDRTTFREEPLGEHTTGDGVRSRCDRVTIAFDRFAFPVDVFRPLDGREPRPVVAFLTWSHELALENGPAATFNKANLDAMLDRGYAVVNVVCGDLVPDEGLAADDRSPGLFAVYPGYDFGAVAAWGFGVARAVDYVASRDWADPAKIAASGHSRLGKAVLSAAVFDERIALVNPNGSGLGGSGCFRVRGDARGENPDRVERIADMVRHFPHWFNTAFAGCAGREEEMPIDHHTLKALVAPRALISTEAFGDVWANPYGTLATTLAAQEVFRWLGVEDRITLHFREGGHAQDETDVEAMLDFADEVFFGRTRTSRGLPFPVPPPNRAYRWRAPDRASG